MGIFAWIISACSWGSSRAGSFPARDRAASSATSSSASSARSSAAGFTVVRARRRDRIQPAEHGLCRHRRGRATLAHTADPRPAGRLAMPGTDALAGTSL